MEKVFKMRLLVISMLVLGVLSACGNDSSAENGSVSSESSTYPDDVIEMVIPASPGGDTDRNGRLLSQFLSDELGESVVVQNVDGSSGSVGAQEIINSEPDGHRVLFFHNNILINNIMGLTEIDYSDFKMVGISMLDNGNGLVVREDSPHNDLNDLINHAKENPDSLNLGTNVGSFTYIQTTELSEKTGAEFNLVDSGDFAETNTALLGGQLDVIPMQLGLVKDYIDSGEMRALGVFSEERLENFPEVPTFKESGIDSVFEKFFFLAFPPETPDEIVDKFAETVENVTDNEEYVESAKNYGITPVFMNAEEAEALMEENYQRYEELLDEN